MRVIKEVRIDDLSVTVREMVMSDLRVMMRESDLMFAGVDDAAQFDVLGAFLFEDLRLSELKAMTDLTDEQIERLAPSELAAIVAVCREVNQPFFDMRRRLRPPPEKKTD